MRAIILIGLSIFSFTAGKNYQKIKTIDSVRDCVNTTISKLGKRDIQDYYGHGALPNTLPHAEAYVSLIWSSCFFNKYLE